MPPEQQQTTVLCMKWHNITENNIYCFRKVSAASKPRTSVLVDVHLGEPIWPPAFPRAQHLLPHQKRGGTATAIHFVALQGELKAKAGESHPGSLLLKCFSSKETGEELRKTGAERGQMLELNLERWCRPRQELGLSGMLGGSWAAAKGGRILAAFPGGCSFRPATCSVHQTVKLHPLSFCILRRVRMCRGARRKLGNGKKPGCCRQPSDSCLLT